MDRIGSHKFGKIVVDGRQYDSDVVIYDDRVKEDWRLKTGHTLHIDDIAEVLAEKPSILIVGTGTFGRIKVPQEVAQTVTQSGIELIARPTKEACKLYNEYYDKKKKVVAILHLTC